MDGGDHSTRALHLDRHHAKAASQCQRSRGAVRGWKQRSNVWKNLVLDDMGRQVRRGRANVGTGGRSGQPHRQHISSSIGRHGRHVEEYASRRISRRSSRQEQGPVRQRSHHDGRQGRRRNFDGIGPRIIVGFSRMDFSWMIVDSIAFLE